jgi:fructokinase
MNAPTVVGLGEILWDLLPSGPQLGGAPSNFAYCSHLLGDRGLVASRVGNDQLGENIRDALENAGLSNQFLQSDHSQPTGTARVQLDSAGQPKFEIMQPAAWDYLDWTKDWQYLAKSAGAICFGSLAQRSEKSRTTILNFLSAAPRSAMLMFDVNLREPFFSAEIVCQSLQHANAMKLSHEEVPRVKQLLAVSANDDIRFCRSLMERFDLKLMCITRGANGSLLCDGHDVHEHAGYRVEVKNTVGAGDAFTAALVHEYLRQRTLAQMNDTANRMGAWVASQSDAMPESPAQGLDETLADLA